MKILISLFLFASNSFAHLPSRSDSGIKGKPYTEIVNDLEKLAKENQQIISLVKYGETINGRPLIAMRIKAPLKRQNFKSAILISGSTHGNEYLNIADRLPEWFVKNAKINKGLFSYLSQGGVIYVIPILNPDGYEKRSRYNSNGKDLNRDFTVKGAKHNAFIQSETKNLSEFLDKELVNHNLKLEVTVDYHCCDGSLLYPWSYKKERMPEADLKRHIAIGENMKKNIGSKYRHGITGEILGYYPVGTSKDYYYERYKALAFTFEGKLGIEDENFEKHTMWWSETFKYLLNRRKL